MRCLSFALLLALYTLMPFAAEPPAQDATPESIARRQFNQVFVKVIMPVTADTPKQDGPVVEAWVAEQLKQLGEADYFAVTSWVPVCDGLLSDDEVDNRVWGGRLGKASICPVCGDLPERKGGRVLVSVVGWSPEAVEARVTLADEPGTRIVEPALSRSTGGAKRPVQGEKPMAYVAILIGPPPQDGHTGMPNSQNNHRDNRAPDCSEALASVQEARWGQEGRLHVGCRLPVFRFRRIARALHLFKIGNSFNSPARRAAHVSKRYTTKLTP